MYDFHYAEIKSTEYNEDELEARVCLFGEYETPIKRLVTMINELASDSRYKETVQRCFAISMYEYGSAKMMIQAHQFFQFKITYLVLINALRYRELSVVHEIICLYEQQHPGEFTQPGHLTLLDRINQNICHVGITHIFPRPALDRRVYPYFKYIIKNQYETKLHELTWALQAVSLLIDLSQDPRSYLFYLVKDLRQFLIKPYLREFYRYL